MEAPCADKCCSLKLRVLGFCATSQGERGGTALISALSDRDRNGWGCVRAGFRLDFRESFFLQSVLGTAQAPQGMGTAPRLPELQEGLDTAPRDAQGGIIGVSEQGQELDQ